MFERIWTSFRGAFVRRAAGARSPGQAKLLQAARLTDNKEIGRIVEDASIDDLDWFLQMMELQIEETPHWVKDESDLHKAQVWYRRLRTMTTEVLHNKRVASRRTLWLRRHSEKTFYIAVGALAVVVLRWLLARG